MLSNRYVAIMCKNTLSQARNQVRNSLGTELARKASDAFILALAQPSNEAAAAAESRMRVVVELRPQEPPTVVRPDAVDRLRASVAVSDALKNARSALYELGGEALAARADVLASPAALLRSACVKELKDRCYQEATPIRDELHRCTRRVNAEANGTARAAAGVQFSWINQSFAAWTNLQALAELAADPRVHYLDLPRRIKLHIKGTAKIVGAIKHREHTGHGGKGVKVAVIDSEVALLEKIFQRRVAHMKDFTGEGWGHPHFHGTSIAAIIAAKSDDAMGLAPDAEIYNYKVMATESVTGPEDIQGASALSHAVADGMDIANCSWGTDAPTDGTSREVRACDNAWKCGLTVVHAAGNDGKDGPFTVVSPADATGVIVVGATGLDGTEVQEYSSRGPTRTNKPVPDLVAPGGAEDEGIFSFDETGEFVACPVGTSFAAPHVTGILALLLQANTGLTPDEQFHQLKKLCKALEFGGPNDQGLGLPSLERLNLPLPV